MTRIAVLVLIVAVLIGGAIWLSQMNGAQPVKHVEKVIPVNALAN